VRTRPLLVTALVVLSVALADAKPPIPRLSTRPAAPPPADTFDRLVDRLAELRAEELDLLARRAALERQVGERLAEQTRRLQQVGVSPAAVAPPILPPAVLVAPSGADRVAPIQPAVVVIPETTPVPVPFSADAAPPPPARRFTERKTSWCEEASLLAEYEKHERESGWTRPGGLADRFDALGGLPLAYTRRLREAAPRRASETIPAHDSAGFYAN